MFGVPSAHTVAWKPSRCSSTTRCMSPVSVIATYCRAASAGGQLERALRRTGVGPPLRDLEQAAAELLVDRALDLDLHLVHCGLDVSREFVALLRDDREVVDPRVQLPRELVDLSRRHLTAGYH